MIEIYDCTLREGEQSPGASFSYENRLLLCKILDRFGVDYIELGWPIASEEIASSFKVAMKTVNHAKIVAFGSTSIHKDPKLDSNLNSIIRCGAKYACIFGKTSLEQIEKQLRLTKDENLNKIFSSILYLKGQGLIVFYDAEHYFDGFKNNPEYSIRTLIAAIEGGAERIILCDTNGGTLPEDVREIVKYTYEELNRKGFKPRLGVHFHEDSGLALSNTLESLKYIEQVQGTINGIGERVGNLNFSEFLPVYIKKLGNNLKIDLRQLKTVNEEAYRLSGVNIPEQRAFVGELAFAHKGGVHIDATNKGASYEHENPEEFGNKRIILLNSLGGRSAVITIAESFGYKLDKDNEDVKNKIKELFLDLRELEKQGYRIGHLKAEQFLIIHKHFIDNNQPLKILEWSIQSELIDKKEKSRFLALCKLDNESVEENLEVEGGPVDCAFKALKKLLKEKYPEIENLKLSDFHVSIAQRKNEESTVRTEIDFIDGEEFSTVGVDKNILASAIKALEKGFNYYLLKKSSRKIEIKPKEKIK